MSFVNNIKLYLDNRKLKKTLQIKGMMKKVKKNFVKVRYSEFGKTKVYRYEITIEFSKFYREILFTFCKRGLYNGTNTTTYEVKYDMVRDKLYYNNLKEIKDITKIITNIDYNHVIKEVYKNGED